VSDILPVVIAVAAVFFVIYRLRRQSGAQGPRPRAGRGRRSGLLVAPSGMAQPALRLLPLPGDTGLVAAREFRVRARGRVFRIGTLLVLVIVSAAIVVPALLGHKPTIQRVGVAGALSAPVRAAVIADGPGIGVTVKLVPEPSGQAATADLRAGRIDLAVLDGSRVVTDKPAVVSDTSPTAQLTRSVARSVGTGEALQAANLTAAQAAVIAGARPLPLSSLQPGGPGTTQRNTSYVGLLLLFFMLTQYNAWTLTGVLEEKSSRIAEVLLAALPPARLLAGKVLGIGLTAFLQAGLAVAVAIGEVRATHSDVLNGLTPLTVAATLTWLVLGYAFYAWVYAAAGSTADRQEQAQSLLIPLGLPVIFGFFVAATAALSGNPSALVHVLAYLPPTAPFAMPVLVSLGAASWWQFALSAAISVACTFGVARAAIAVYRASILRTGSRVSLRELMAR
jgi:ABC-2 type transport system permease protein